MLRDLFWWGGLALHLGVVREGATALKPLGDSSPGACQEKCLQVNLNLKPFAEQSDATGQEFGSMNLGIDPTGLVVSLKEVIEGKAEKKSMGRVMQIRSNSSNGVFY